MSQYARNDLEKGIRPLHGVGRARGPGLDDSDSDQVVGRG